MAYLKFVIRPYLYIQYFIHKILRRGSFGDERALTIRDDYKPSGNILKDGLFLHHVKQFNEASCSVASMAAVVNTLLDRNGSLRGHGVTQHELLARVRVENWKARMNDRGYRGRRGLPLETLGRVVRGCLHAYDLDYKAVEVVPAPSGRASEAVKEELRSRLLRFERSCDCLILAHFDQGCFLRALHIPHISPVGGFDPVSDRVIMLDVDPFAEHPYEISLDTFYEGLASNYNHVLRPFGFRCGGYIAVWLNP